MVLHRRTAERSLKRVSSGESRWDSASERRRLGGRENYYKNELTSSTITQDFSIVTGVDSEKAERLKTF